MCVICGRSYSKDAGRINTPPRQSRARSEGYEAAKQATLNCLSSVTTAVGDLDKVPQVVKLIAMVNGAPDLERHFVVGNGASHL